MPDPRSVAVVILALVVPTTARAIPMARAEQFVALCDHAHRVEEAYRGLNATEWTRPEHEPTVRGVGDPALPLAVVPASVDLPPDASADLFSPPEVLAPPGPVLRARDPVVFALRAREYARRRATIVRDVYEVVIPSSSLPAWTWDADTVALVAIVGETLPVFDGAVLLRSADGEPLVFPMSQGDADVTIEAHEMGGLAVRLSFTLMGRERPWAPFCTHGASGEPVVDVRLVSAVLVDAWAPEPAARAETVAFAEEHVRAEIARVGIAQQGSPIVEVTSLEISGPEGCGYDDSAILQATMESLFSECYLAGLERNANLRGALVLSYGIQADGVVTRPAIEIDVLDDMRVNDCIMAILDRLTVPLSELRAPLDVRSRVRFVLRD